jgi:hypothetical protein
MIEITNEQMERVNLILNGVPNGAKKAFYNAINRGLQTVRTQSGKSVNKTYRILQKDFKSETNITEKKASQSSLIGEIAFAGTRIPLIKFQVSPKEPQKQTVSVAVLRETGGERLKHAFVAKMQSGHVGVFERATPNTRRLPIEELYGPSPAGMLNNIEVQQEIEKAAQETIDKRIEHEITRILNGYGG